MKIKKILIFLAIILVSICLFSFSNKVNAATISDDGQYALILGLRDEDFDDGDIDGNTVKVIKFNVADGETTVSLSELTKGIVPFNGKYEFAYWGKSWPNEGKADENLALSEFKSNGSVWLDRNTEVKYANGLSLCATFSDKELKGTGTYYLTLDGFAGTINGKNKVKLTSSSSEYQTIDLSKYKPVRDGYTFVGWDLNGKFVTSIDSSYFANRDAVAVTATYTKNSFEGDDRVLILNANGGTISGKSSNKYDYVGGANSGTSMSLLPYTPVREGYTFNGWNTKKDGSGKSLKYIYWRLWDKENSEETEKDTVLYDYDGYITYQNLTLYATWTKNADTPTTPDKPVTPTQPTQETVKEIQSTGETKAKIEFADGIDKDYKLDIQEVEIKKELADKNVKFIADINVLDGNTVVKISDTKMKIRIAMPDDLKEYNKYEVVYILNDEIKETIPASVEDGYIVFETSHLSQYGIVATNVEEKVEQTNNETNNPKTADNIMTSVILFIASITAIGTLTVVNRKKLKK